MLLVGTALMSFFLYLVGGLQGGFGAWGTAPNGGPAWIISDHDSVTKGVIVCSYLFVCRLVFSNHPQS